MVVELLGRWFGWSSESRRPTCSRVALDKGERPWSAGVGRRAPTPAAGASDALESLVDGGLGLVEDLLDSLVDGQRA